MLAGDLVDAGHQPGEEIRIESLGQGIPARSTRDITVRCKLKHPYLANDLYFIILGNHMQLITYSVPRNKMRYFISS